MGINTLTMNRGTVSVLRLSVLLLLIMGCETAADSDEYRESQGTVGILTLEQVDPLLRIAQFVKLKNGTVSYAKMYRYPGFRKLFDPPNEKKVRSQQIITSNDSSIYLPMSKEIASYLFLISKRLPIKAVDDGERTTDRDWSDWQLFEIPATEISKDKPIVIPPFEELAKRELTKEQEARLKDLVERYEKIEAKARKKASTPVPPRDSPMIRPVTSTAAARPPFRSVTMPPARPRGHACH